MNILSIESERMQRMADILKVVGHPLRLQIIQVLGDDKERSVQEIISRLGKETEQSLLSHHLQKLKDKRLLVSRRSGSFVYYSLKEKNLIQLISCISKCK